jgi:hypothetical protein
MKLTPLTKLCLCLVLLLAASTLHPRPAFATCSACLGSHNVICWSWGATCADAQASLAANCESQATEAGVCGTLAGHGACNFAASPPPSCYWNGSQYQIDATGTVGCRFCGQ